MESTSPYLYFDHAATTALAPQVLERLVDQLRGAYGNPSSTHRLGTEARASVESARATVAGILGAKPQEIFFTSGGTESDNLALRGVALANKSHGRHIITTSIEHHAIGHTCEQLASEFGFVITYVPVDRYGLVNPDDIGRAITRDTCLISVMYANNEVGTIEPIAEIGRIAYRKGIAFHTDAVQAPGYLNLEVNDLKVDLLSLSAHKFYGPKGIGVLYVRDGVRLMPVQTGGGQEMGLRAGTENVAGIVGLATALQLVHEHRESESARLTVLRDRLIEGIIRSIPQTKLTGHASRRLANNASFVFAGVDGANIVRELDSAGIAASSGSACTSCDTSKKYASHVLRAIGYDDSSGLGSLRLTLGTENQEQDVHAVLNVLPEIIGKLRGNRTASAALASTATQSIQPSEYAVTASAFRVLDGFEPSVTPSAACPSHVSGIEASRMVSVSDRSTLVYALGQLVYDFGTEIRRDSFIQQSGRDVSQAEELLHYLHQEPSSAASMLWTLALDSTPIYAIRPEGPYAASIYERLRELLQQQQRQGSECIAVPGTLVGSVMLENRHIVPVLVPELRGISSWSIHSVIESILGEQPAREQELALYEAKAAEIIHFLERVFYELRNTGISPRERAINYAATRIYQLGQVFTDIVNAGMKLDIIDVDPAPICRPSADCWDVKLVFFNPSRRLTQARRVYRLTVDVSDIVPVSRGKICCWDIY